MINKIKKIIEDLNKKGIPVPVFRDNVSGKPSITYTLFYITGFICILSLIGKFVSKVTTVDFDSAKELVIVFGSLYLGRKVIGGNTTSEKTEEGKNEK